MAVRLPVVLSQSSISGSKYSGIEESWIAFLLFEARLDATLVSSLTSISLDSTDQLCLEGMKGDFLLLTWLDKDLALEQLVRLGISPVELVPVDGSAVLRSESTSQSVSGSNVEARAKKVYWLGLMEDSLHDSEKELVKSLLHSLSTPVFRLGGTRGSGLRTASTVNVSQTLSQNENASRTGLLERLGMAGAEAKGLDNIGSVQRGVVGDVQSITEVNGAPLTKIATPSRDLSGMSANASSEVSCVVSDASVPSTDLTSRNTYSSIDSLVDELNDLDI